MLLRALLDAEKIRIETAAALDARKHEFQMKQAELELHELERIGEEKRKTILFNERVKEERRKNLNAAREKQRAMKAAKAAPKASVHACEECQAAAEGRQPRHSSDLIRHANEQHELRFESGN